jgi:chloramphenicol-sensitive protein RarD
MGRDGTAATGGEGADRAALASALVCYLLWGLLPILFICADRAGAGAFEIVAWRTLWSLPCAGALALAFGGRRVLTGIGRATLGLLLLSSGLIAVNWSTYVWAVEAGRTLSASLGYYILPLLNMAIGAAVFRERITRLGFVAIALAAVGVGLQGLALGQFPWISIVLALSFGGYGVVRKIARVEALGGLLVECLVLVGPAAAYAAWLGATGHGVFGARWDASLLLALGGPATVVPLALFTFAARRLPLSTVAFLQFITPTLQFMVGVEAGETLTPMRLASFGFIWAGVAVFAARPWIERRARVSRALAVAQPE